MTTIAAPAVSDLVRFLLARVEEDEDELRTLRRHQLRATAAVTDLPGPRSIGRQLDECAAKRNVIGHAQRLLILRDLPSEKAVREAATELLRALALPYCEHGGFRPEWRTER